MIITLCGSTRFKSEFEQITRELTMSNHIVLAPGVFAHADQIKLTETQKRQLEELHLREIDMSQCIYVIDVDGYIGTSTQREIHYARRKGKPVWYWTELHAGLTGWGS
ncbi:hypothetical protein [Alicyclobacillus acidoterrestris]|uniref:Uncharacterized protein n=1 Tax=Alicyclobacillus acidoterrestris (strain ATCC 49025 / DSM 3922 / CIP 106132 / NCIMB 13137 / GD3B) TaxID=1356854 RepID=T0BSL9_ALIAG|nr:hypothetical protein [Alicyclobacillus acidoterrestris]EPZ43799.1 hypothetical protein N007_12155 [Alicyclobacillus acidoterrestris ATCC 49025]UNO50993.1 hypothetical protein K1I37_21225 [Alicyclobacillus acidoterrestris]GEO27571.1 hypothetical protein AAC03nite_33560 [Alicyclobacillus acidoterrestris]